MPTYKVEPKSVKAEVVSKTQLDKLRTESAHIVPDIVARATTVNITSAQDYADIDADLQLLTQAEKRIEAKFRGTPADPGPITTIRKGLDQLYALERELMTPLKQAREIVIRKMKDWKNEERLQLQAAQEEQERQASVLRQQAEERERKAALAKSPVIRERLESQSAQLQERAEEVAQNVPQAIAVTGSTSRFTLKVKVNDIKKLARGVSLGLIPSDVIMPLQSVLSSYLKSDEESVREWSEYGVEVYSDAVIVRHG